MSDRKGSEEAERVREWHKSKLTWALIIVPVVILGMMVVSWLDPSDPSSSDGAATTNDRQEKTMPGSRGMAEASRNPDLDRVRAMSKSSEDPLWMEMSDKKVVVELTAGVWSRQIVTPDDSTEYKTFVSPILDHFYIWFQDGTVEKVSRDDREVKNHGIQRGIFRVLVEEPGRKLKVTIR